jgi:hypothetical protein
MPIRQATPDGGGRSRPDSFKYFWTPPDQPWTGWNAGPVQWVKAHTEPSPTKPCLKWLTYDFLPCPRCRPKEVAADVGYMCVYREIDWSPILVVLHDNMYDTTKSFKYGEYVKISRPAGPDGAVLIQRFLTHKEFVTSLSRRKQAVDSVPMLIRLWKIAELTTWYECQQGLGLVESAKADETAPTDGADTSPQVRGITGLLSSHFSGADGTLPPNNRVRDGIERGKKKQREISNGKHPPSVE